METVQLAGTQSNSKKVGVMTYRGATIESLGVFKGFRVSVPPRIARDRRGYTFEVYTLEAAQVRIDAEFGGGLEAGVR